MAIRNTSHDGPPAFQTCHERNSARILRLPNLCVVNAELHKNSLQRQMICVCSIANESMVVLLTSHTSAPWCFSFIVMLIMDARFIMCWLRMVDGVSAAGHAVVEPASW